MINPKNVLVVTTSSIDGLKIKQYLKPVSAHIVAGTNLFSDFLGGLSDLFGGRSQTYQVQLVSLYNEAIEQLRFAAYELGTNCILGLSIDMDEISGKGKSMFMLTAIGTAVILEKEIIMQKLEITKGEKFENVSADKVNVLKKKKSIIEKAMAGTLKLDDDVWNFITSNQVDEIFSFLLKRFTETLTYENTFPENAANFYKFLITYIDALSEERKLDFLYNGIKDSESQQLVLKLSEIIRDLRLFDFKRSMQLLKSEDFRIQKRGLSIARYDKAFYNVQDKEELQTLRDFVKVTFSERGRRTMKKQLLSSKEREVWTCECGKVNEMETYCVGCAKDIYGFKENDIKPETVVKHVDEKVEIIAELIS